MAKYKLHLYISGQGITSLKAIDMMNSICDEHLKGECDIEIIDIEKHPERAEEEDILAIPTLIRLWPLPVVRMIGALTIKTRVITGLGIDLDEGS